MNPSARFLPSLTSLALLAACGGGGGGSAGPGGTAPTDVTFTSFDAVQPNQRVVMPGLSQTMSGTIESNSTLNNVAMGPLNGTTSTARLTFDAQRNLTGMSFSAPQSGAAFVGVDCSSGPVCTGETANSAGVASNPRWFGWNYQSYGVWLNEPTLSTFQAGALSAGTVTPGSAVPTTGTATFTGLTSGFYTDPAGVPYFTSANMSANVNWGTRTIGFTTANTTVGNLITGANPTLETGLNLTGSLSYALGTNQFTGTVTAPGVATSPTSLTGTATGRFYGPAAEEMGGVYSLSGSGTRERLIGAFGAKR